MRELIAAMLLALSACATVERVDPDQWFSMHHRLGPAPDDWPDLIVVVDYADNASTRAACAKVIDSVVVAGCAFVNFDRGVCHVTVNVSLDRRWHIPTLNEELKHCRGQDHVGESTMRDAWARYKSSMVASNE